MKDLVDSHAVAFKSIGPDINLGEEVAAIRARSGNVMMGLMRGMRFSFDMLERSHKDILALGLDSDLLVVPAQSAAGKNEAELLQRPYLSVNFLPWGIPWNDPERPLYKRIAYGALDGLISLITNRPLNRMRSRQGLPPVGSDGFMSSRLNLIPISPVVYPPNPLWAPHHHLTGYWFAEAPGTWQPPADLLAFLDSGESPLLVSLGAMSLGERDAPGTATLFVNAIQRAGLRAIIQSWGAALEQLSLPVTIFPVGALPHDWLLPRCAGIVHHGGFGTTSAGLRAGIPALVIPHLIDQFYWAQRIFELGVGPQPIRRARLDEDGLAGALEQLSRDDNMRQAAAELGEQIRLEDGLAAAVHLIEHTFQ